MGCSNCTFVPEPFKSWGFLSDPHPSWPCRHSYGNCRYCDSCSAWWHRPDMEEETDEGDIVRADCPNCIAFAAEDERADLETKLDAALEG